MAWCCTSAIREESSRWGKNMSSLSLAAVHWGPIRGPGSREPICILFWPCFLDECCFLLHPLRPELSSSWAFTDFPIFGQEMFWFPVAPHSWISWSCCWRLMVHPASGTKSGTCCASWRSMVAIPQPLLVATVFLMVSLWYYHFLWYLFHCWSLQVVKVKMWLFQVHAWMFYQWYFS